MAALTTELDTPRRSGDIVSVGQGTNVIFAGGLVAINASGVGQAAADTAALTVIGRAETTSDNSAGATVNIDVRRGVFRYANQGNVDDSDVGDLVYVLDDQTVARAADVTNNIPVGRVVEVDSDGVWVDVTDR